MNEDFLHKGVYCASLLTPSLRRHKLYRSIADFVTHISPTAWGRVDCPTHTKQQKQSPSYRCNLVLILESMLTKFGST